jgi:hypothetical protein
MPVWIDMIPVFSAIVTVAGISMKIGRILQKLDNVSKSRKSMIFIEQITALIINEIPKIHKDSS